MNKIVLYLMSKKGLEILKCAIRMHHQKIHYIVVARDASIKEDYFEEMVQLAGSNNITCYQRGDEPELETDVFALAISWRWMIRHDQKKLIVFHDSILPKFRGFAPLVNMLIKGEGEIGVSAICGASEYDRGDIIAQSSIKISYPIKISEAIDKNIENYEILFKRIVHKIQSSGQLSGTPQREIDATYSIWRDDFDYFVDWERPSDEIKRFIDAVGFPYLGARTRTTKGDQIILADAEVIEDVVCELRHVGKVIFLDSGVPTVICGTGLLRITEAYRVISNHEEPFLPMKSMRVKFLSR